MLKIALLSDTHSFLDDRILDHVGTCDEVWHAGDFGNAALSDRLAAVKPLRGVYGNIDGGELRKIHPLKQRFVVEQVDVLMIHIGGYPGRYDKSIAEEIKHNPPDLFISGHSHILKVMRDNKNGLLHMNPGAAGKSGFHKIRTMLLFDIDGKEISNVRAVELGSK